MAVVLNSVSLHNYAIDQSQIFGEVRVDESWTGVPISDHYSININGTSVGTGVGSASTGTSFNFQPSTAGNYTLTVTDVTTGTTSNSVSFTIPTETAPSLDSLYQLDTGENYLVAGYAQRLG